MLDYAEDHLGIQGSYNGFLFIEGAWYCPGIPGLLANATIDWVNKDLDEATYEARLSERWRYLALSKEAPDAEGFERLCCPASGPHRVAACPLKPASQRHDGRVTLSVRPSTNL